MITLAHWSGLRAVGAFCAASGCTELEAIDAARQITRILLPDEIDAILLGYFVDSANAWPRSHHESGAAWTAYRAALDRFAGRQPFTAVDERGRDPASSRLRSP
jgi:hypothetical protein